VIPSETGQALRAASQSDVNAGKQSYGLRTPLSLISDPRTPMLRALAALATMAALAAGGCGSAGKAVEEQHEKEHPCQFHATSKQCEQQQRTEDEEARHETGVLRERARVEAERTRLKKESGQ
jgi:hypothetical protein